MGICETKLKKNEMSINFKILTLTLIVAVASADLDLSALNEKIKQRGSIAAISIMLLM